MAALACAFPWTCAAARSVPLWFAHVPMEMDWQEGQFFESSGLYLMCATHGAIYEPDTGRCVGGPCRGAHLSKLDITERDGAVWWQPDALFRAPAPSA